MSPGWRRGAGWVVALAVIWVLLNGQLTVGNVVAGVALGLVVLLAVPVAPPSRRHRVHPLAAVRYLAYVLRNLVTSSIGVVVTSLRPTDARLRSGIVRAELPGATPLVTTLVANAITLTPGTTTVTADADDRGGVLHVHVLGLVDAERARTSIGELHRRATAAFTPRPDAPAQEGP